MVSTVEIARKLGIDHKTVLNYLHKAGYKKKLNVWVPHELSIRKMMDRINIYDTLLKWNEISEEPFLKKMIIGDEKWITYDNPTRKRSWIKKGEKAQAIAKPGLTRKKVMLCVWWDWKGIVHYEIIHSERFPSSPTMLLSSNQTINSELYCEQLRDYNKQLRGSGQN